MSHKIFENDLVAICKKKVTLSLNKPAYIYMCTLELITVLINMVTTENSYSQTLILSCVKLKLKMAAEILGTIKK